MSRVSSSSARCRASTSLSDQATRRGSKLRSAREEALEDKRLLITVSKVVDCCLFAYGSTVRLMSRIVADALVKKGITGRLIVMTTGHEA